MTRDEFATQLERTLGGPLGALGVMYEEEAKLGARPLPIELRSALMPSAEWERGVITRKGDEIRLVAILAKQPGSGAFRRLIAAVEAADLRPVIVCPVGEVMPAIMKRWKWTRTLHRDGDLLDVREEWRP